MRTQITVLLTLMAMVVQVTPCSQAGVVAMTLQILYHPTCVVRVVVDQLLTKVTVVMQTVVMQTVVMLTVVMLTAATIVVK